jgi:hypothetical protein
MKNGNPIKKPPRAVLQIRVAIRAMVFGFRMVWMRDEQLSVRVRECVFDVIGIFMNLALCVLCTGTWFTWRRDFKRLAQKLPKSAPQRQKIHLNSRDTFQWHRKPIFRLAWVVTGRNEEIGLLGTAVAEKYSTTGYDLWFRVQYP